MKTTQKNLSKTRVEITVKLEAAELETAASKALVRLAADLKVSGFRKGKVPAKVARKHIPENDLAAATLDIAVRTAIPPIFQDLRVVSTPEVQVDKYVPGESLEFRATADILPEIKLGNYKSLKTKKPAAKVEPKAVDEVLQNIANSFAEKKAVNRAAKLTDEVQIDFIGKRDGEPFEGGTAKDFKLVLGSHQLIPGFEDGIVGHQPGDQFTLSLTFPQDYHVAALAGKQVTFDVLLKQVNEVTAPAIDDQLAQKAGPFKSLKDLKADIETNLKAQSEHQATERYKDALVAELVKSSSVEAPDTLIADQLRIIQNDLDQKLKYHHLTAEDFLKQSGKTQEELTAEQRAVATDRVKSALVLQVLAAELGIAATEAEATAKATELREVYKKDPNALKNLSDPRILADIRNRLSIEKTLDSLVSLNSK